MKYSDINLEQNIIIDDIKSDEGNDLEENYSTEIISSSMKKDLLIKILLLTNNELLHVVKIIKQYNIKYTENNNGIFINLSNIDNHIVSKLYHYINLCYNHHKENEVRTNQINKLTEEILKCSITNENNQVKLQNKGINQNQDKLEDIKNNKNLNSLEKAIMRQNIANSYNNEYTNSHLENYKKSQKYTGIRARLFKTCKEISKNDTFTISDIDDKKIKKKTLLDDECVKIDI